MELWELKRDLLHKELGIVPTDLGRVLSFIDFGNVNYWFHDDDKDENGAPLSSNTKLGIDIQKLADFLAAISSDTRFYYGHDPAIDKSVGFTLKAKKVFGKNRVFTKPLQKIRHYLDPVELAANTRAVNHDHQGDFIIIPKCNFDVEISVDAIRLIDSYDTICLLSSDADFVSLLRFLKKKDKKVVLVKGGRIQATLGQLVDLKINAQDIKKYIAVKKQKPGS